MDQAKPYIRQATLAELDELTETASRAFLDDPMLHYCADAHVPMSDPGSAKDRRDQARFLRFLIKSTFLCKHRNTVVVLPSTTRGGKEKIVAGTLWLHPGSRPDNAIVLLRAGCVGAMKAWGRKGLVRLAREYEPASGRAQEEAFKKRFKGDGKKLRPRDAWFLQLAWTDPEYQGRGEALRLVPDGYLSMLIRDQFAFAPREVHALDASGPKSRDRYEHLGFEENCPLRFGVGKVDADGVVAKDKEKARGLVQFSMTKWVETSP
ncbi:hypothetical protein PUNSTDRAFT_128410 [Punctularia strigosozonata HHB-11173 SS5]|uniref:N-acetyltransferase domain-containing protein n=1 Tax=Punctularia strigosozonata (strain HHB-11173) TaxID=741275 RepID=R7S2E4_PUNST|nr:uncharacterized protein PUNSTDRAFT_128410 [Punctularia strigosozonata HHB-11173 SS5]EIN04373.1 hypothetical protein PUNSTDRAFT_128410 [Punctularia strigosozonata HHB-11173 SS5]